MSDLLASLRPAPLISFAVLCRDDPSGLEGTLAQIERCGMGAGEYEILVVDPACPDATREIGRRFPMIAMMVQAHVPRVPTLRDAMANARGRYVVLLEDDCFPRTGSLSRMIMHFEREPGLAAAVFTVTRSDGVHQAPSFPNVIARCGTGLRRRLFSPAQLPAKLAGAGAEYDLSLGLLSQGWEIRTFDDLHVTRSAGAGELGQAVGSVGRGIRDDLDLVSRYFPQKWVLPFARDWMRRQRFLAASRGRNRDYYKGLLAGLARAMAPHKRRRVDEKTFESLVRLDETESRLRFAAARHGLSKILLLDYSANLLVFYLAAKKCGIQIVGIADAQVGSARRRYRGIPVVGDAAAREMAFDATILTTLSPTLAAERLRGWRLGDRRPVVDLFDLRGDEVFGRDGIRTARVARSA